MTLRDKRVLLPVIALLIGAVALMEQADEAAPWLQSPPAHAEETYGEWRSTAGGWAVPEWHLAMLALNPPDSEGPILVDRRHSRKQTFDTRLSLTEVRYKRMHGLGELSDILAGLNLPISETTRTLTGKRLGGASALFLNLPSGDGPGFTHAEVVAIESFVRAGGGLVVLTDHSNAYFHAEMLEPLLSRLGVQTPPATACDQEPGFTLSPKTTTWIAPRTHGNHPVVEKVSRIGLMTGGAVVPRDSDGPWSVLATTSGSGWMDHWHPYRRPKSSGFTGNMAQDADEPMGPVPVLAAAEIGAGRVVVLGDQNAWGSVLLGFEDNAQLAANAFLWAAGRPSQSISSPAVEIISGDAYACGTVSPPGFHTFFVAAARKGGEHGARHSCRSQPGPSSATRIWLPQRPPELSDLSLSDRHVVVADSESSGELRAVLGLGAGDPEDPWRTLYTAPGGQEVWWIEDAQLLQNRRLGRERVPLVDEQGTLRAEVRAAFEVLDWAYGSP